MIISSEARPVAVPYCKLPPSIKLSNPAPVGRKLPSLVDFLIVTVGLIAVPSTAGVPPTTVSTTYPDAPDKLGSSCAGVLPSPNILLIVANEGLLITGAMYVLKNA